MADRALSAGSHAIGAFSPLLGWPVWIFQALMSPGMVLTALTAFYIAAMNPAAIAVAGAMLAVRWHIMRDPGAGPAGPRATLAERARATLAVVPMLAIFAVVVISIYGGWSRPTEASAVGVVATGLLAVANGLRLRGLLDSMTGTALASAMIFLILTGADMLNSALAFTGLTIGITGWIVETGSARWW